MNDDGKNKEESVEPDAENNKVAAVATKQFAGNILISQGYTPAAIFQY